MPADSSEGVDPGEGGPRLGWVELGPGGAAPDLQDSREEAALSLQPRLHSLADAERLFDELTQEKQQVRWADGPSTGVEVVRGIKRRGVWWWGG